MRILATIGAAALAVSLVGCGSGEPVASNATTTTTKAKADRPDLASKDFVDLTGEADPTVQARDNNFVQPYVTVKAGTTVTFVNKGRNQHDVVPVEDGAFRTVEIDEFERDAEVEITFEKPGDYAYYCTLHGTKTKGMVGAIRVVGA
ncbi:MAG: plastocyanin/azurin family copper-binding protein [Acidimicrobiales bacterium]|nr:cupredoxin domain-containing protein [Acidimicrobiales bacterium]